MEYNLTPPPSSANAVNNVSTVRLSLDNTNPTILPQLAKGGAVINGVVQNRTSTGMVVVKTDFGNINLKSELFLKRGADIVIKMEQKQSELIAKIISINGLSPTKYQAIIDGENAVAMQDKITTSSNVIDKQVNANQPIIASDLTNDDLISPNLASPKLRGVFVQQPKISPELLQQIAPNISESPDIGTALRLKIINILLPEEDIDDALATLNDIEINDQKNIHNQANIALKQGISPQKNIAQDNNIIATPAPLNYLKNLLVINNQASNNVAQPNVQFNGVVLHQANMRELTMQTEMGMVKLFLTTPLPKGAIIQFELLQLEQVRGGTMVADLPSEELLQQKAIPATFPAIEEIKELKHIGTIPTPLQLQPHIVPRLGANLAAEMMFFLNAIAGVGVNIGINTTPTKQHDALRNWLGDELLQQIATSDDGSKKISSLNNELNMLKQSFADSNKEQWQSALIPLYDGQQLRPIQFFMKKKQSVDKDILQTSNHFMLEFELSNIGLMQLDCLVQQQVKNQGQNFTKFDMIIRTQQPWEDSMKNDIINIFTNVQQISGLKGAVQFKHGHDAMVAHPEIASKSTIPSVDNSLIV